MHIPPLRPSFPQTHQRKATWFLLRQGRRERGKKTTTSDTRDSRLKAKEKALVLPARDTGSHGLPDTLDLVTKTKSGGTGREICSISRDLPSVEPSHTCLVRSPRAEYQTTHPCLFDEVVFSLVIKNTPPSSSSLSWHTLCPPIAACRSVSCPVKLDLRSPALLRRSNETGILSLALLADASLSC